MPRSIFRSRFPTASRWHFSSKELDSRNDDNLNRRSCFYPSYIIDFMKTRYRSSDYFGQQCLGLLFLLAIGGILNTAEAQPLPIRVGYTALAGSFTPLWVAKELGLFERQGIQSSPIYMAAILAYQAMLAGETGFTVGASIPTVQARLGGADALILVTYIGGFTFS